MNDGMENYVDKFSFAKRTHNVQRFLSSLSKGFICEIPLAVGPILYLPTAQAGPHNVYRTTLTKHCNRLDEKRCIMLPQTGKKTEDLQMPSGITPLG